MSIEIYYCNNCKTWISPNQVREAVVFKQTLENPEEKEEFCSLCGGSGEDFDSIDLDEELLAEVLNELKYTL